jgi:hypothetical protein
VPGATPAAVAAAPVGDPAPVELEEQEPEKPVAPSERMAFSLGAARSVLAAASNRANACKSPEGPSGQGRAMVTFSPDGPVSSVSLSAPFLGTPVGSCVATAFRSARVPAFTGSSVTLPQTFRIPSAERGPCESSGRQPRHSRARRRSGSVLDEVDHKLRPNLGRRAY